VAASPADAHLLVAERYFCGRQHHDAGPYAFHLQHGRIVAITAATPAVAGDHERVAFLMPGLVEAHGHLFLDGAARGGAYRGPGPPGDLARLTAIAEANVRRAFACGISLIRDAGDRHGINDAARERSRRTPAGRPAIRSPGSAIRRAGSYGKFMAMEVATSDDAVGAVERLARTADDIKIILTGIVDFAAGAVTEGPQFDAPTLRRMVECAHRHGRPVFVHCSGEAGIERAIAAGVDSIEHGYFMTRDALQAMAERGIAWVPTVAPVHFQWAHPEVAGWPAQTVAHLRRILDAHLGHIALADQLGVRLIAGSDAGSPGVPHGDGLIDELFLLVEAGLPMARALAAATAVPRAHWGCAGAQLQPGSPADFIVLGASPVAAPGALRGPVQHYVAGQPVIVQSP
jgi:imidazolonepropionase-like amidohydrolase